MDSRIWIIESHRIQTGPKRCPSRPGQAAPARSRHSNAVKSPAGIEYSVVRTSIWSRVTVTPFGLCKCGRTPRGSCQGWPHVPARPKSWRGRRASSVCVSGGGPPRHGRTPPLSPCTLHGAGWPLQCDVRMPRCGAGRLGLGLGLYRGSAAAVRETKGFKSSLAARCSHQQHVCLYFVLSF
jgi:hypothetical protein